MKGVSVAEMVSLEVSLAHFKCNELGHQVVKLPWQRLQDGRQVSDGQLTTDGGECVIRWRGHDVFLSLVFDSRLG